MDSTVEEVVKEEPPLGFGPSFVRRFIKALRLGVGWRGLFMMFVQLCMMGIYGLMICIVFQNYGTSIIISKITGTGGYVRDVNGALNAAGTIIGLNIVSRHAGAARHHQPLP